MIVPNKSLVYFAYPKCASEFMRSRLKLKWNNTYDHRGWEHASIEYCHAKPRLFVEGKCIDINTHDLFTVVRNPFDRLVSLYTYFLERSNDYPWIQRTFKGFVTNIYNNRNNLESLPLYWMLLPVDKYFEGIIDRVQFFKIEKLGECFDWLSSKHDIFITNEKTNTSNHNHYSMYYDEETRKIVSKIYKYEIVTFGYKFNA